MFTRTLRGETVFDVELLDERPGFLSAIFSGDKARGVFASEAGGHRWQRVPPTETRGRRQTSTVTVAVLNADAGNGSALNERDIEFSYVRGTGPGGQHRNTTNSCCVAKHRPSGESVRIDLRSQHQSKAMAVRVLAGRLEAKQAHAAHTQQNGIRKSQLGSGMRGDKIRTYRTQNNQVTDHRTGNKSKLDRWLRGEWP